MKKFLLLMVSAFILALGSTAALADGPRDVLNRARAVVDSFAAGDSDVREEVRDEMEDCAAVIVFPYINEDYRGVGVVMRRTSSGWVGPAFVEMGYDQTGDWPGAGHVVFLSRSALRELMSDSRVQPYDEPGKWLGNVKAAASYRDKVYEPESMGNLQVYPLPDWNREIWRQEMTLGEILSRRGNKASQLAYSLDRIGLRGRKLPPKRVVEVQPPRTVELAPGVYMPKFLREFGTGENTGGFGSRD